MLFLLPFLCKCNYKTNQQWECTPGAYLLTCNINIMETKKVLTFEEAANYMGMSKSCLYKLTSQKIVPHYKPTGKMIFFDKDELEIFLLSVRIKPQSEIEEAASTYVVTGKHKKS